MPSNFQFSPYDNSRASASLAELYLRQGEIAAEHVRQDAALRAQQVREAGQGRAQVIGSLGHLASGGIEQYQQYKAQAPQRQMQALQLQHVQQQIADEQAQAGFRTAEAGRITQQQKTAAETQAKQADEDQRLAALLQTDNPTAKEAFAIARERGLNILKAFREGTAPPQKFSSLPANSGGVLNETTGVVTPSNLPSKPPPKADFTIGDTRYSGETNQPIATNPRASATDEPALALTPEGLALTAHQYAMTGQLPPMGMGKQGAAVRTKIINEAAKVYQGLDLPSQQAAYQANKASLVKLSPQLDALTAFESTAGKNLEQFLAQAKTVLDTGSPLLNAPLRSFNEKVLGDPKMAAYNAARTVVLPEFARIISNPNLTGALSDTARAEVESLIKGDATLAQAVRVAAILTQDAKNRKTSLQTQLADIQRRLATPPGGAPPPVGGGMDNAPPVVPPPTKAPPPPGIQRLGSRP